MIKILENVPLAKYTTFKVGGPTRFFVEIENVDELTQAVEFAHERSVPIFILGEGSNILVSDAGFSGLVIKINIKGIEITGADELNDNALGKVEVRVGAGENWDGFVSEMVEKGFGGVENLAFIPGTVGAAPVQNIGAYGAEISKVIKCVEAFSVSKKKIVYFSHAECEFSYRDSVFKRKPGEFIITHVIFNLLRDDIVDISYKDLAKHFGERTDASIQEVRNAVIEIRRAKLPDWYIVGTAGSFFKNPIVPTTVFDELKKKYPEIQGFPAGENKTKILLAWVLDNICGFKGVTRFDGIVGVYKNQALVIVNNGGATGAQIKALADEMIASVKEKIGIDIEPEVQYVGE